MQNFFNITDLLEEIVKKKERKRKEKRRKEKKRKEKTKRNKIV